MSDDRISVPDVPTGHVGNMIYSPWYLKKKGVWVPGAWPSHVAARVGTWAEYAAALMGAPIVVDEKGRIPAMSPGMLFDGSDRRSNRNVRYFGGVVMLDIDTGELPHIEHVTKKLQAWGIEFVFYTSASNGLPGKGYRGRFVIRITENVPGHMATRFMRAIIAMFATLDDGTVVADQSCVDPARVHYMPAVIKGNEHNYYSFHNKGIPLPVEEVHDFMATSSTLVAVNRTDEERINTIANARAVMKPSQRSFNREDIAKLSKNKKARLTTEQRASLLAASKSERMLVVKGDTNPANLKCGAKHGGDLPDENIDSFLTSLMFQVAVYHRNADPDAVQAAFAPSFSLVQDDDRAAGNPPYNDDALRQKFESGVRAADEKSVEDAKKTGLPTFAEFKAEHGIEDEGDLSSALPGKVYIGQRCFYTVRTNGDGEALMIPLSDFSIIPREHLISDTTDGYKRREEIYEADFIGGAADGSARVDRRSLPPNVLMGKKEFNAYLGDINPYAFRGDDDQAKYIRTLLYNFVIENNVPQKKMTHRFGLRREGGLVAPQGSYRWPGGYEVIIDDDAPTHADSAHYETNQRVKQVLEMRHTEVDLDAIRVFCRNVTRQNAPEVTWPILGWFAASALRDHMDQFPILQVVGSRGSGKSSIVRKLKEGFGGTEFSIGGMPRYSQARELSGSCSFPVIAEEYRRSRHHSDQAIRDNVRDLYTRQRMARAGFKTFVLEAPLCIVGEHEVARGADSTDAATMQRMTFARPETTMLDPSKSPDATARRAAYAEIAKCPIHDSAMWVIFPCWAGETYGGRVDEYIAKMREAVDAYVNSLPASTAACVDDRTRYNLSVLLFGVFVWSQWCAFIGADPGPLPTVAQVCRTTIEIVSGSTDSSSTSTPEEQPDPIARWIESLTHRVSEHSAGNAALAMKKFWMREGDLLYIDVKAALGFYHNSGGELDASFGSTGSIYQFARESEFAVMTPTGSERHRKRIIGSGVSQSRCIVLDIPRLENADVSLADVFLVDSAGAGGGFGTP